MGTILDDIWEWRRRSNSRITTTRYVIVNESNKSQMAVLVVPAGVYFENLQTVMIGPKAQIFPYPGGPKWTISKGDVVKFIRYDGHGIPVVYPGEPTPYHEMKWYATVGKPRYTTHKDRDVKWRPRR